MRVVSDIPGITAGFVKCKLTTKYQKNIGARRSAQLFQSFAKIGLLNGDISGNDYLDFLSPNDEG